MFAVWSVSKASFVFIHSFEWLTFFFVVVVVCLFVCFAFADVDKGIDLEMCFDQYVEIYLYENKHFKLRIFLF